MSAPGNGRHVITTPRVATPSSDEIAELFADPAGTGEFDPEERFEIAASNEVDLPPGTIIDGRYRLGKVIGQGGMGRVYEAEHVEIGRKVAVKILLPQYSTKEELVVRFRREARAASRIGHPNIVDVTDSGVTPEGSVYFVMELLTGVDLGDLLSAHRRLPPERAVRIAVQVCRALAAAHAAGIIHRDLKPENVYLVEKDGKSDFVKVLDFGIAKAPNSDITRKLTTPGIAMGTPEYMSPEQAMGNPADARSDVFALGAILYELLTGTPPHDGEHAVEILSRKLSQKAEPLRKKNPTVPEALEDVIMSALERDAENRPQTMGDFEAALLAAMPGLDGPSLTGGVRLTVAEAGDSGTHRVYKVTPAGEAGAQRGKLSRVRWLLAGTLLGALAADGAWMLLSPTLQHVAPTAVPTPPPVVQTVTVNAPASPAERVAPLLEWAQAAAKNDRFVKPPNDNVKDLLGRILVVDPGNPMAAQLRNHVKGGLVERARGALHKKRIDEAAEALTVAHELDGTDADVSRLLAQALILRADRSLRTRQAAPALADAMVAAELVPDDVAARLMLGDALSAAGRRDQAEQEYRRVLERDPAQPQAQKRLAALLKPQSGKRRRR
jgi:tRNA A-37 threonylcarbamoyl transferase component Bud32/tetratricopeptide (TPR) repeat protein